MSHEKWIQETGDLLHERNGTGTHNEGFCRACAEIYAGLNEALIYFKDGPAIFLDGPENP